MKFPKLSKSKIKTPVIEAKAKPPVSEARRQLADLIEARAKLVAKVEVLHAAAKKLDAKRGEAAPIEAEIQKLDATERESIARWAKAGGEGRAPKPDAARRARLDRALAEARASANASTAAQAAILADHAAVSQEIASIAAPTDIAIAAIIAESCDSLISEFDADNRALAAKMMKLNQALEMVLATLDGVRGTDPGRAVSFDLERLHGKLKTTFAMPPTDLDAASQSRLAWRAFSDGLRVDANLKLDAKAVENAEPAREPDMAVIIAKRNAVIASRIGI